VCTGISWIIGYFCFGNKARIQQLEAEEEELSQVLKGEYKKLKDGKQTSQIDSVDKSSKVETNQVQP